MLSRIFGILLGNAMLHSLALITELIIMSLAFAGVALVLWVVVIVSLAKRKKNTNQKSIEPTVESAAEPEIVKKPQVVQREVAPDVVRKGRLLIRYNKSFTARLIQAEDDLRDYYDELKNELLSYKGVKSRISWKHESFRQGRVLVAKLKIRGKHITVYLPLNPADYIDSKYKIDDVSNVKTNAETPCAYAIKNDRRCRYAKELIATVMRAHEVEKLETAPVNYSNDFPYDTTDNLIERKLIKLVYSKIGENGEESIEEITDEELRTLMAEEQPKEVVKPVDEPVHTVTVEEAKVMMTDEQAKHSVEQSVRYADKTKSGIINVDTLARHFEAGETVTLEEIKRRVPSFDQKVTYIKVLARGVIDKALTVEADEYSIDAVKMIVLTGGTVTRTQRK